MNPARSLTALTLGLTLVAVTLAPLALAQSGKTIRVGSIGTLSGPYTFPESSAAAKAYFDKINAAGGVNGVKIDYLIEDDKADPAAASQAARRLVDDQGVVAMVGSASLLECSVNSAYYGQHGVLSVQGTGVDPVCFASPSISPVNTGPYVGISTSLYYASNTLKKSRICAFFFPLPGSLPKHDEVVKAWTAVSGKKLVIDDRTIKPTDDPTPFILRAKQANCDAVLLSGIEPMVVAWMNAVKTQGLTSKSTWMFLTPAYTDAVARTLGASGEGMIAAAEFEPFTNNSAALSEWRQLMTAAKVPLTSFAQGGYLSAKIFVDTMKTIKGDVTRDSVSKALRAVTAYNTPLIGTPYEFANRPAHNANSATKMMRLRGGKWVLDSPNWVRLPSK